MIIAIETKTTVTKRKILNFQIQGNEIAVNYKIGFNRTDKMVGGSAQRVDKAVIQSDVVKLSSAIKITITTKEELIYEYTKKEKTDER